MCSEMEECFREITCERSEMELSLVVLKQALYPMIFLGNVTEPTKGHIMAVISFENLNQRLPSTNKKRYDSR
jgi:hypothetical protein